MREPSGRVAVRPSLGSLGTGGEMERVPLLTNRGELRSHASLRRADAPQDTEHRQVAYRAVWTHENNNALGDEKSREILFGQKPA